MSTFTNAHDFKIHKADFSTVNINNYRPLGNDRRGLRQLLAHSIPEAAYDSSARDPPPLCHPGTRTDHIEALTNWCIRVGGHPDRIKWVKGPAGVGKTAVLQSVAEAVAESNHLGASFFFSRPNNRKDPMRLFTTIAYQLSAEFEAFADILDGVITRDPAVLQKNLSTQFKALLVDPICKLTPGEVIPKLVIVIDGLDECEGFKYQTEIIQLVASSVMEQTIPFLWIISSRLDHHLVQVFDSAHVNSLVTQVALTISREIDEEICKFLSDKLADIARKHELTEWPSDRDILLLVDLSAGHFAYATVAIHFINDDDVSDPKRQLERVLLLRESHMSLLEDQHPLSRLDNFYKVLILERLTPKQLQIALSILLTNCLTRSRDRLAFSRSRSSFQSEIWLTDTAQQPVSSPSPDLFVQVIPPGQVLANMLGLSEETFRGACRSLHGTMYLDADLELTFYHASFMEFLEDSKRSQEYCIWSHKLVSHVLHHIIDALDHIELYGKLRGLGLLLPKLPVTWGDFTSEEDTYYYREVATVLFDLIGNLRKVVAPSIEDKSSETEIATKLRSFQFAKAILSPKLQLQPWPESTVQKLQDSGIIKQWRFWNSAISVLGNIRHNLLLITNLKQPDLLLFMIRTKKYLIGDATGCIILEKVLDRDSEVIYCSDTTTFYTVEPFLPRTSFLPRKTRYGLERFMRVN